MNINKILLNITSVFCFIFFALYTFSLIFIPIGIYCFLAGKRFAYKAEHLEDTMRFTNKEFKYYVIFVSIACFPFGLLSIIPYLNLASNNISVSEVKEESNDIKVQTVEEENDQKQEEKDIEVVQETNVETYEEKMEKFRKLENFKEKGLITEEELEQAREQLFGSKQDN